MVNTGRMGFTALVAFAAVAVAVNSADAQQRRGRNSNSGNSNSGSSNSGGSSNSSSSGSSSTSSSSSSGQSGRGSSKSDDDEKKTQTTNNSQDNSQNSQGSSSNSSSSGQMVISGGQDNSRGGGRNNSRGSGQNNNSRGNTSSTQQNVQQGVQQALQGGGSGNSGSGGTGIIIGGSSNSRGTQTMQGNRNSRGQVITNSGSQQQIQNFQPWQMWQGQNNQGNNRGNVRSGQSNQKSNSNWIVQFGGGTAPFSVGWYEKHPHAWHHHHNNSNDAWKVATAAGVIGWLGWGAPYTTQVVYVPQPVYFDPEAAGPWMRLGVYSLLTGPSDTGTRILHLSVNQQGYLRGSYYDMITDETYNVRGRIDQPTQYAQWSIDTNRQLTFYTPLYQLTQSQGVVNAALPGGTQQWQVVRMEFDQ